MQTNETKKQKLEKLIETKSLKRCKIDKPLAKFYQEIENTQIMKSRMRE